jgi:hypothetical protein
MYTAVDLSTRLFSMFSTLAQPPTMFALHLLCWSVALTTAATATTTKSSWNLFNRELDHYTKAMQTVQQDDFLHGIEMGRAAARFDANSRDAFVNLGGYYLNFFNKQDYHKPISHTQTLELFTIMDYAQARWPRFHGTIHNMESTLRWLCSSASAQDRIKQGLVYDETLNGQESWQAPVHLSKGDRLVAYEYGRAHALPIAHVLAHRGPLFIPAPYQTFRRNATVERTRIARLHKMARKKGTAWKERQRERKRRQEGEREVGRRKVEL